MLVSIDSFVSAPISMLGKQFMDASTKIKRLSLNIYSELAHTLRAAHSGRESPMAKQKRHDTFVTVTSNGSVSVELGSFIRSDDGQKQLAEIRELQQFTRSNNASSVRSQERKKAEA
jgi:hypothetical protein